MPFGKIKVRSKKHIGQRPKRQFARELDRYKQKKNSSGSDEIVVVEQRRRREETADGSNTSSDSSASAVKHSPLQQLPTGDVFSNWSRNERNGCNTHLFFTPPGESVPICNLVIYADGQYDCSISGVKLRDIDRIEYKLPASLISDVDKANLKLTLETMRKCEGNNYPNIDISTMPNAYKLPSGAIHSNECLQISRRCSTCKHCKSLRDTLELRRKRQETKTKATLLAPTKRISHMTHVELKSKCSQQAKQMKSHRRELQKLRQQVEELKKKAVPVEDEHLNKIISHQVIQQSKDQSKSTNQFSCELQTLLWEEQIKQAGVANKKSMRWHPAIIRWALTLRSMSKSSYDYIRDSGGLALPSSRTLDYYTCYKEIDYGLDKAAINQFSQKLVGRRDVVLMHDEMKIKNKLVYHRATGDLVGYVALDDINHALQEIANQKPEVATHALCFIARAITQKDKMPVAHYATSSLTGCQIYHLFWEVVRALDCANISVKASISDGAGSNRRFFDLHSTDFNDGVTFRCHNKFSEGATIYFVSDVPHLLKTTRNCMENSGSNKKTRDLILHGKPVRWSHVTKTFRDTLTNTSFTRLHKLRSEHVYLQPYSRMKVNLAAQVLSQSMANAMKAENCDYLSSTIEFIEKFNQAFDILNIRSPTEGRDNRKPMKEPFSTKDDHRYEWLQNDFLGWMEEWRREVESQPDLSRQDQERCMLSHQTILGWNITCNSFIHLSRDLLDDGYDYVLSEKILCQDIVELHFGFQRKACGTNKTPNAAEYLQNEKKYSVFKELQLPTKNGNCSTTRAGLADITNVPKLQHGKRNH